MPPVREILSSRFVIFIILNILNGCIMLNFTTSSVCSQISGKKWCPVMCKLWLLAPHRLHWECLCCQTSYGHGWRNVLWFMMESVGTHTYFHAWNIHQDYFRLSVEQSRCWIFTIHYHLTTSCIVTLRRSNFESDQQTTSLQINILLKTEHKLRAVVCLI